MIRVVCECGRVFQAEDRHSGKGTRCPACGASLVIGRTPASGSGSGDRVLEDLPSWWYPAAPGAGMGAGGSHPRGGGDPEVMPTVVIEPGDGPATAGAPPGDPAAARSVPGRGAGPGGSSRGPAIVLATAAAIGLVAACWVGGLVALPGGPRPAGTAALAARPEGVRGQDPGGPLDRKGPSPADKVAAGRDRGPEAPRPPARAARRLRLLVPAYIYPNAAGRLQWHRLMDAAAKVEVVAIVNPDSGPGVERNPDYAAVIAEAADRGVKLVGYVSSQFGGRTAPEVKGDVEAWIRFYPRIVGIFLDQQPIDARHCSYVAEIGAHARKNLRGAALIITNPGVPCDESYLARRASDVVGVFTNSEGFARFELPAHLRGYEPSRYAALVYQVAEAATMRSVLKDAIVKRIGSIYVTDGKSPNPWDRLPAYWEAEVEAVAELQ